MVEHLPTATMTRGKVWSTKVMCEGRQPEDHLERPIPSAVADHDGLLLLDPSPPH
jgi:hypothetical protein